MINRTINDQIARDITEALAAVAEKHGLATPSVDLRFARDGSFCRLMKMDLYVATQVPSTPTVAATGDIPIDVQSGMAIYKIKSNVNIKGEKLVAYKPNRYKYPFVMEGPRGGRWKLSSVEAQRKFGTN